MRPRGWSVAAAYGTVAALVAAVVAASALLGGADAAYGRRIAAHRQGIWLRLTGPASPLSASARAALSRLDYFPPDASWRVAARLVPIGDVPVEVDTTGGTADAYLEHAWAEFELQGRGQRLLLLREPGDASNRLFLPFRDATSGGETYGGGRYLDLYPQAPSSVEIDFNLAYNPYCVYDPGYICPLAPPQNTLDVAIRAGERAYRGSAGAGGR